MSKKLLVIGPDFFGYKKMIIKNIYNNKIYNNIKSISDVLPLYNYYSFFCKKSRFFTFILTFFYNFYLIYYVKIFKPTEVFVLLGRSINKRTLSFLKSKNIKTTLYMWDSLINYPHVHRNISLYDKVYTFDKLDALKYSLIYEPLFYNKEFVNISNPTLDFVFIGSVHGDRLEEINKLKNIIEGCGATLKVYFYMPSLIHYFKAFYLDRKLKYGFKFNDFFFKPKSIKESYSCYSSGNCIIDIPNANQSGYTMRTFEVLGSNRKIITTNKALIEDSKFKNNNVYYLSFDLDESYIDFILSAPFNSSDVIENQELTKWVSRVLLSC